MTTFTGHDTLKARRTLDVGGDKPLPYWPIAKEENPFLGVRGIRLTLQRPQIMEAQLRALLRSAAENRPLSVWASAMGSLSAVSTFSRTWASLLSWLIFRPNTSLT